MTDYTEQLEQFALEGELVGAVSYGSGHINDTCLVTVSGSAGENKYILQRINTRIFENPQELMENIVRVTDFLRDKIQKRGGDPWRETLNVIPTKANESFYRDSKGECWRMYRFIDGAVSLDQAERAEDLYQGGLAFGRFQQLLADYLQGDVYFKVHRKGHNLDRCRTQLKLVQDMEAKWTQLEAIVSKYAGAGL